MYNSIFMVSSCIRILFLCSVLLAFRSVCFAEQPGVLNNYFSESTLTLAKTSNLYYTALKKYKTYWNGSDFKVQPSIILPGDALFLSNTENFSSKKDGNENGNILGMYIIAGYGKLRYNFEGSPMYEFDYELTKGGGVSFEIPLLTLNERFSIYNELGFSVFNAKTSQHTVDTAGGADPATNYYETNLTFSPNTVTLSNIVRYTLTPRDFKYYVAIGIYNSFVVSSTNQKETYHYVNGEPLITKDLAVPDPSVYGMMLLVCTGFSYKNIGFEIRFDPGRSYSNKLNYAVYMPTFDALLHVRFNPK